MGLPAPASLVVATRNPHKLAEFRRLLAPAAIRADPLPDAIELPPEVGETFDANARRKARAAAAATGLASIADDSGIESDALRGHPGVRSARYAGEAATDEQNLLKLMREAPTGSGLRYVCAVVYVDPAQRHEQVFRGDCRGTLAAEIRGPRGFGYDPAFLPDGDFDGLTMAELSDAEKDRISHRGSAVRALLGWLAGDRR